MEIKIDDRSTRETRRFKRIKDSDVSRLVELGFWYKVKMWFTNLFDTIREAWDNYKLRHPKSKWQTIKEWVQRILDFVIAIKK
jgi:hypothetical protein